MAFDENKFRSVVIETLRIQPQKYKPDLRLGDVPEWDSIAHMDLVAALEEAFGVRVAADEIVELASLDDLRARISQLREA